MYSVATPSGSIAAFSLYCRYLAVDVTVAASWSLLSNQDCISNILASFTGSPSAILTYRLYSSIDLLLHSTFTRRRWFLMEEERSGAGFRLEQERSGGGLRGEERKSGAGLGSIFLLFCVFWVKV